MEALSSNMPNPKRYAEAEDWIKLRSLITTLYIDIDMTLAELKDKMAAEYGFLATTNMFKKKFATWNVSKNLRMDEVVQILGLKRERDAAQKRTVFHIRGRKIDPRSLQTYLSRNPSVLARLDAATAQRRGELGLTCRTPSPPPTSSSVPTTFEAASEDVVVMMTSHRLRPLAPLVNSNVEQLLHTLHLYIDRSFDTGLWSWDETTWWNTQDLSKPQKLLTMVKSRFGFVCGLIYRGVDASTIGQPLDACFEILARVLKNPPINLISRIMYFASSLKDKGHVDIRSILLGFIHDFSAEWFGRDDAFTVFWRLLIKLQDSDFLHADENIWHICFIKLQKRMGVRNRVLMDILVASLRDSGKSQETRASDVLKELSQLEACNGSAGLQKILSFDQVLLDCKWHLKHGRLTEAEDTLKRLPMSTFNDLDKAYWFRWFGGLRLLRGNLIEAEAFYREGVFAAKRTAVVEIICDSLFQLEVFLRDTGKSSEAANVCNERLGQFNRLAIIEVE